MIEVRPGRAEDFKAVNEVLFSMKFKVLAGFINIPTSLHRGNTLRGDQVSLQHAILGLLSYRPMSGYDLKQVIDQSINYFWSAQLSQIYRDLGALESKGYVCHRVEPQEGRPDKKVYDITEEGKKAFQAWLEQFPQMLSSVIRDEFVLRIFFGSRLAPEELAFQFKKFIKEKQKVLESCGAIEKLIKKYAGEISRPGEELYWRLTLKKGFIMTEASIRWAEECLKELKQQVRHPWSFK